mmetsp:Transcript_147334/g.473407  ORF Transcript_147334/g.473407 Transcript_147334/m.473407 type:complete len:271 (-) Transcript_147334:809-1621(-)
MELAVHIGVGAVALRKTHREGLAARQQAIEVLRTAVVERRHTSQAALRHRRCTARRVLCRRHHADRRSASAAVSGVDGILVRQATEVRIAVVGLRPRQRRSGPRRGDLNLCVLQGGGNLHGADLDVLEEHRDALQLAHAVAAALMRRPGPLQEELRDQLAVVFRGVAEPIVAAIPRAADNVATWAIARRDTPQLVKAILRGVVDRRRPGAAVGLRPTAAVLVAEEDLVCGRVVIALTGEGNIGRNGVVPRAMEIHNREAEGRRQVETAVE